MTRIVDLPEKVEAASTDYLLVDDPTIGTRRISRDNFLRASANNDGGGILSPWKYIAGDLQYQLVNGDRLIIADGSALLVAPAEPNIGDSIELIGLDTNAIFPRKIEGITKVNSETVIGASVGVPLVRGTLIYVGGSIGWICEGSSVCPRYPIIPLNFASNGDTNGLIYYLGTNALTESFSNPHTRGAIQLTASSAISPAPLSSLVDRATSAFYTSNSSAGQWVKLKINLNYRLILKRYLWRSRSDSDGNHLRNWNVQGSNDDMTWTNLDVKTANTTINGVNFYGNFPVTSNNIPYQYFRVLMTGLDSTNNNYLTGGEWELYGDLIRY